MKRTVSRLTLILALVALLLFFLNGTASAQTAHRANAASSATRASALTISLGHFVNDKSSRCIGIISGQNFAGDWACVNAPDQIWSQGSCSSANSNFCQLINNNGKCLGVDGGSTAGGARILNWTCNGHADQYWAASACADGNAYLVNLNSNDVIGVLNGSTANGAELIQWSRNGNLDQCWHIA